MFAKIFEQIFSSSIAEDYRVRHGFMDLLVLADSDGVVDMMPEAIARRTNVPLEQVQYYLAQLQASDEKSRSPEEDGARIKLIDSHRDWGWQIVNYAHYRELRDEAARRDYFRDRKRAQRASHRLSKTVQQCPPVSNDVTQAEAEAEAEIKQRGATSGGSVARSFSEIPSLDEVKTEAINIGLAEWVATMWWTEMEGLGWKVKGQSVAQWRKLLAVKRTWWEADGRPMQPKGRDATNQSNPRPGADRSANTLNAGKSGQYAGIGRMGKV